MTATFSRSGQGPLTVETQDFDLALDDKRLSALGPKKAAAVRRLRSWEGLPVDPDTAATCWAGRIEAARWISGQLPAGRVVYPRMPTMWQPGTRPYTEPEVAGYLRVGVRDLRDLAAFRSHCVSPDDIVGYRELGITDRPIMIQFAKQGCKPTNLRNISSRVRSSPKRLLSAMRDVGGFQPLTGYVKQGVFDLELIARLVRAKIDAVDLKGYSGAFADGHESWFAARSRGIRGDDALAYSRSGFSRLEEMTKLREKRVLGADAVGFVECGVSDPATMARWKRRGVAGWTYKAWHEAGFDDDAIALVARELRGRKGDLALPPRLWTQAVVQRALTQEEFLHLAESPAGYDDLAEILGATQGRFRYPRSSRSRLEGRGRARARHLHELLGSPPRNDLATSRPARQASTRSK